MSNPETSTGQRDPIEISMVKLLRGFNDTDLTPSPDLLDDLFFNRLLLRTYELLNDESQRQFTIVHAEKKRKVLATCMTLFRVNLILANNGISIIHLKGPILSLRLFGNLFKRESRDVDILVRRNDCRKATEILLADGFVPEGVFPKTEKQWQHLMQVRHHLCFYHPVLMCTVELHWRLLASGRFSTWDNEGLFERTVRVEYENQILYVSDPVDEFIYLCLHGARHAWFRLCWLHDLHVLLQKHDDDFIQQVIRKAASIGVLPQIYSAFYFLNCWNLSSQYMSLIPENMLVKLHKAWQLSLRIRQQFRKNPAKSKFTQARLFYRFIYLLEGRKGAVEEWRQRRYKPENWSLYVFPDRFFVLNHLLARPIWMIRRLLKH